jgi:chromosome segregation ATPase
MLRITTDKHLAELQAKIRQAEVKAEDMTIERDTLKVKIARIMCDNARLDREFQKTKADNEKLTAEREKIRKQIEKQAQVIRHLEAEIERIKTAQI